MKYKAVFFDLDGTLLPMDQNEYIKAYLGGLVNLLAPKGYDPGAIAGALWASTGAMIKNDGSRTNEEIFWDSFCAILGAAVKNEEEALAHFYSTDFHKIKGVCGFSPLAKEIVNTLKNAGVTVVLATNPVFPAVATESRIRWAGLDPSDFDIYTTYENSRYCKPNLKYYEDLLSRLGLRGEECLMVGNDVGEDMITSKLGMDTFLLTDCLINNTDLSIEDFRKGGFEDLLGFIKETV